MRDNRANSSGSELARTEAAPQRPGSPEEACTIAFARLRVRLAMVVQAVLESIPSVPADAIDHDDEYFDSRAAAVTALLRYVFDAIGQGTGVWGPLPRVLVNHAHRAARVGVRPGRLVRHYEAGHRQFIELIKEEVDGTGYDDWDAVREHLRRRYRPLVDHIVYALEREHEWAAHNIAWLPEQQRRRVLVRRLLVEDLAHNELKELDYDVHNCWHLGIVASGAEAIEALRRLKAALGRSMLCAPGDDKSMWLAWLSAEEQISINALKELLRAHGYSIELPLATGDPGCDLRGWRQTHEEALLALPVAERACEIVRCANILPIIAAAQSEAIISAYKRTYLLPLNSLPRGGRAAREALRAYFKHERIATSAGYAADLSRKTIANHIREVKDLLPDLDLTMLEIALRLEELGYTDD